MGVPLQLRDFNFALHKIGGNDVHLEISDEDDSGSVYYYGYIGHGGVWCIVANDTAAKTWRYKCGVGLYTANWAARATLTYLYYSELT